MGFLKTETEKRRLPDVLLMEKGKRAETKEDWKQRREEIRELLCREFCGYAPSFEVKTEGKIVHREENAYGGKAFEEQVEIGLSSKYGYFSFPFMLTLPKKDRKAPVFVYLSFTPVTADGIGEEIIDNGYGIANVYCQDIAADREDGFSSGIGRFAPRNRFDGWGKLAMWAYGTQRVLDYLLTREDIDPKRIGIMGHSRLGKAALVAGGLDERFSIVISNDSGGGGAAVFRQKTGEHVSDLARPGTNCWFCGNFFAYAGREEEMPFDQHFLLALAAPRALYVCSASEDVWADPDSEYLSCFAASDAYRILGEKGLEAPDRYPEAGESFPGGMIGYHMRKGTHHLGREDWANIIHFRNLHGV